MRFGKIVKMVRKERGMTQIDLAARIGVSSGFLWEVEQGRKFPSVERTIEMARVLNVNLDQFILERLNDQMPEGFVVIKKQQNGESRKTHAA